MALYTFTYTTQAGRTQSFRCAATSKEQALLLWADERTIARKVYGPITATSIEVA